MTDLKPRTALSEAVLALPLAEKRELFNELCEDLWEASVPPERHALLESALHSLAAEYDADPAAAETWNDFEAVLRKYGVR